MLTRKRKRQVKVVPEENEETLLPQKCRICLNHGIINIFGVIGISDDIKHFGCIEINFMDNLPQHICDDCHALLQAAILFRTTAQRSEKLLKNMNHYSNSSYPSSLGVDENKTKPELLDEPLQDIDYKKIEITDDIFSNASDYNNIEVLDQRSQDSDYLNLESLDDTDNETFIKREYLEYMSDSGSELDWKTDPKSEHGSFHDSVSNFSQSEYNTEIPDYSIKNESQYLKVKEENHDDLSNEMVMIIVSDKSKTNTSTYGCVECKLNFKNQKELKKHAEDHLDSNIDQKKCDICNVFVDISNYKVHIKQHREKYKERYLKRYGKVECSECGKKVGKAYYKYHMKMHGTVEEQAERLIHCSMCNKSISAHYLSEHMKRVHDKKRKGKVKPEKTIVKATKKSKKCPVCDKMISENDFKEHLSKHGGSNRRYICEQCGRVFKHPSAFRTHVLTHGSELKYQCQFCPYRGLHLGLLKIHVRTHTGDYNYKCTECPARFITKSNLSKHLQRHQGVCNFKCETCNKGFYSKRDVDKHYNTVHLELKDNVCDICGKGFGHRDNMMSHQLKVHKRDKITEKKGRLPSYLKEENKLKETAS